MPVLRRIITSIAGAVLLLAATVAHAERIAFESAAKGADAGQIFQGQFAYRDHIYGELTLPSLGPSRGPGPFPVLVIMHSSRGVVPAIWDWAKLFNDMGVATFVVDSFTPRHLTEASTDQLTFPAGVVDALRALKVLRQDPRIDAKNIGVIGFSRGAVAAMGSSFERYRAAVMGDDKGQFALHIVFYGGCAQYAKTTGSPILAFVGTADDFNNIEVCRKDAEVLRRQGAKIDLVEYEGALHGFDTDYPRQAMPMIQNFRNCRMLQNLDTFEATLVDGRVLTPQERTTYSKTCVGRGAVRGGDRKYAAAARERVKLFVAAQFKLPRAD